MLTTHHNDSGIRRRALIVLSLILLAFAGCSDEPTEENSLVADLPLAGFTTIDTTIEAVSGQTVRIYSPMEGLVNLLGKSGQYTAYTLVRFYPTLFPIRDTVTVYSATLRIQGVRAYGTPGASTGFTIHKIIMGWNSNAITWDSVQTGFYEAATVGSFSGTVDQDTASITIPIDTAMVRRWYLTGGDATNFGMILIPSPAMTNAILGFADFLGSDSSAFSPTLTVIAGSPTGPQRDTSTYSQGIDSFVGTDEHPTGSTVPLVLQGGVNYRSTLFFDLSFIPRGAIVNGATMLLDIDPANSSISSYVTDTSFAAHLRLDSTTVTKIEAEDATMFGRRASGSAQTWAFNIRRGAQSWVKGPNYGILIRVPTVREFSSPDIFTFFNVSAATPSVRPRLKLLYSVEQN